MENMTEKQIEAKHARHRIENMTEEQIDRYCRIFVTLARSGDFMGTMGPRYIAKTWSTAEIAKYSEYLSSRTCKYSTDVLFVVTRPCLRLLRSMKIVYISQ